VQVQQIHRQADRRCFVVATLWLWRGAARHMMEDAWLQVTAWKGRGRRTRSGRLWQTGRCKVSEHGKSRRERVWTCFVICTHGMWFCVGDYPYTQRLSYLTIIICEASKYPVLTYCAVICTVVLGIQWGQQISSTDLLCCDLYRCVRYTVRLANIQQTPQH
jgi:hypothetical protein